jgi:hypothetical protein
MQVPFTWPIRGTSPAQQVMPGQQATCIDRMGQIQIRLIISTCSRDRTWAETAAFAWCP